MAPTDPSAPLFRPLIAAGAAALLLWAFAGISGEMLEGDTGAFDMAVLQAAASLRSAHPWLTEVMRDLSGLGSTTVLALCTLFTVGYLAAIGARPSALGVAAAVIAGSLAVSVLKTRFGRPRPDAAFSALLAPGMSFPSGHAAMSAIVFLTLGALLARTRSRAFEQLYILAVAALLTVLVGVSRLALGVHWATDVVAGWALGAAWALACLAMSRRGLRGGTGFRRT